ncbi:MAG TPA: M20/M25/M40 family metallo-hydrolase, partial [Acetobacteraceae bacterium]|nr:M20/M25/M40 family metallo-hydrolase [Acetobacteraceae bacterium]
MHHQVIEGVKAWQGELAAIRQDIHAHPELGMEEVRTSALVARELRALGIEVTEGIGRYGVVGTIKGARPGQRVIGLRADMDALQIAEATGKPYASKNSGVMHACGHDGHTTMLLGA